MRRDPSPPSTRSPSGRPGASNTILLARASRRMSTLNRRYLIDYQTLLPAGLPPTFALFLGAADPRGWLQKH
eukprot:7337919-Pyramimonas_sp.AAC.1